MTTAPADLGMQAEAAAAIEHARRLDPLALDARAVRRLSREARRIGRRAETRIAFAGNIVFEPLPEFLEAHLLCHGTPAACYVAPFGQPLQELLDPASGLRAFDPSFLLLHFEHEALLPALADRRLHDAEADCWRRGVSEVLDEIRPMVNAALAHTGATVLLTNFVEPDSYDLGLADARCDFGEQDFYAEINAALRHTFRAEPRVQIVDLCRLMAIHGHTRARDRRLYYLARLPWHESFLPVLADELARHVNAGLGRVRKCLVVDLDNTLWDGVLGEDGPLGVRIGSDDPAGRAHLDLQRRILAIRKRGVLLAACSKNNRADVEEVFRVRPEMPLQAADFSCMEIGWDMKHEGLARIAARLNLSTDSLVFLDDNPAEIELVRQLMPEVECILVPQDPGERPSCLDRVHGLDRTIITAEDRDKSAQYRTSAARDTARRSFDNLQEYLRSLGTRLGIRPACGELMPRAHQLFSKTNQFNLTTRRYSLAELEQQARDPRSCLLMIRAQDRFGDLGWIGAVLLKEIDAPHVVLDSFILSCRVMGRGIETAVLEHMRTRCFARPACEMLQAEYLPTAKNAPVRELCERHGFEIVEHAADGSKRYRLLRSAPATSACDWIAVEVQS